MEAFLRRFLEDHKPIGLVGLGEVPIRMLLGQEMEQPPAPNGPAQLTIDGERRIVHTPGFSVFTRLGDVRIGVEAMVREVMRFMEERLRDEAGEQGGGAPGP